jgi:hypothetical protein
MKDKESILKHAYDIYIEESRKEVDDLVSGGALVNYREFSYEQYLDAGLDENNPWFPMFRTKFIYFFEKAKKEKLISDIDKLINDGEELKDYE